MPLNVKKIAEIFTETQPTSYLASDSAAIEEERKRLRDIMIRTHASYEGLLNQERDTRGVFSSTGKGIEPIAPLVETARKEHEAAANAYDQYNATHPTPTEQ